LFDLDPCSNKPDHFNERLHLSTDEMVYVRSLLATLKAELDGRIEGREVVIKSTFLLLVTYLSRRYASQKKDHGTPLVRMANVVAHIQQHFREPLRMRELARLAHFSQSQFQRIFKRTYNATPQKFVQQVRLHEAGEMLKDPNRDITDIAFETGFSSSSLFSTQFKRQFGRTPSEYRRAKLAELTQRTRRAVAEQRDLATRVGMASRRLGDDPHQVSLTPDILAEQRNIVLDGRG
jgi:AraC-like DNA-binding protein